MDSQAVAFLQAMAALAVVAVLAFLVLLIGNRQRQAAPVRGRTAAAEPPAWGQILAAVVLILLVALALVWRFAAAGWPDAGRAADDRTLVFLVVMLGLAVGALVIFAIVALVRIGRRGPVAAIASPAAADAPAVAPPSATRLLGLLLLALLLLLLAWTYLSSAQQYAAMRDLIYPASLALALVLLVDKASRAWNPKSATDGFSEWLFLDALVFLQVLAWLNLREAATPETYAAFFFDLLGIALFFLVFWLVDRKLTRLRFLLAYAYLALLPLGLLLWRAVQGVPAAETGWWQTLWPVLFLGVVGTVLELVTAMAWRDPARGAVAAIKYAVFFVAYGVLLLVAIPAPAA